MRGVLWIPFLLLVFQSAFAQQVAENTYWYYFTDKNDNGHNTGQPETFLSQRSIDRRGWQALPVDEADLPVTPHYIDSLEALGIKIVHTSKWLNGVLVTSNDTLLADTLYRLPFVDSLPWKPDPGNRYFPAMPRGTRFDPPLETPPDYSYGYGENQVKQLDLDYLHQKGYTGSGVIIAVLDGGFLELPALPVFQEPLAAGQILAQRNYVNRTEESYSRSGHGTSVSSVIIGNWPDSLVGTAPGTSLILAITEDVLQETRIEEYAWIEAAEWADSLGADIINTSLGYTTFDDPSTNYSYRDMDGKTAAISVANSMAADRGMVSVTSAGNSGNDNWYYIGAPADATNILAVGAVDPEGSLASFSSRGPTYDRRIKPDVAAMGLMTAVQSTDGNIRLGAGTSYASPLIAGATALLWQAYPTLPSKTLMQWIIESGDRAQAPDIDYGYGIPSFKAAFHAITSTGNYLASDELKIFPNPCTDILHMVVPQAGSSDYNVTVYDLQGRIMLNSNTTIPGSLELPSSIHPGIYILQLENSGNHFKSLFIRKQ